MTIPQDLHTADVSRGCMFYDVTKRDRMTSVQSADVIMSSIDALDLLQLRTCMGCLNQQYVTSEPAGNQCKASYCNYYRY